MPLAPLGWYWVYKSIDICQLKALCASCPHVKLNCHTWAQLGAQAQLNFLSPYLQVMHQAIRPPGHPTIWMLDMAKKLKFGRCLVGVWSVCRCCLVFQCCAVSPPKLFPLNKVYEVSLLPFYIFPHPICSPHQESMSGVPHPCLNFYVRCPPSPQM